MDDNLRNVLTAIAREKIKDIDVSHDIEHTLRVLANAEIIAQAEKADLDIIVPSALFHDLVVYPKNHPEKHKSQEESASLAAEILQELLLFPQDKIAAVRTCILECSFTKGIVPKLLESKILQDADGLESTGAISVMRTFSSTGQMQRSFYHPQDPFSEKREPDSSKYGLDLFFIRLLKVKDRMHTKTAKQIATRRTAFLDKFLEEFKLELEGK